MRVERSMTQHVHYGSHPLTIQHFESVTEFYRHCENLRATYIHEPEFYGQTSVQECVRYCEKNLGESHMRRAKELVNKIDASFRDRERVTWHPSPMGAYPIVPDYLANDPFSMRMKAREEDNRAPIRYFIETGVSGGVSVEQMESRAAGIAALVMRTAEERPIELYVFSSDYADKQSVIVCMPIDSHPVDLHSTIAAFATREFQRGMVFANVKKVCGPGGVIDWFYCHPLGAARLEAREKVLREALRMDPQDVVMQGGYLLDAELFNRDPVQWVHNQIEKQRSVEHE